MNVLSKDMQKPAYDIVTLDVQKILGVGNLEPVPADADDIEFSAALANIVIPDVTPKQNDIIANKSLSADLRNDHGNVLARPDMVLPTPILSEQHIVTLQDWAVKISLDTMILPEVHSPPKLANGNHFIPDQIVVRDKGGVVISTANIPLQMMSAELFAKDQSSYEDILMLSPNKVASNIGGAAFVDIENGQEKIPANRHEVISAFSLIPTGTVTGTNTALPQMALLDLLSMPLGEVNSLQQTQISIQMPTQVSSQIPSPISFLANGVILQIREPLLEHLSAVQEALQDRSRLKPKDIIVQLSPAELGRVQIRFSFEAGEHVVARLVAENPETMVVLRQKSGLLLAQLKLGGFENIDLSFEIGGEGNFSEQNSSAEFFKDQNNRYAPNIWQMDKGDTTRDEPQLGKNDTNYLVRSHMHTQLSQIDIIL